MTKPMNEVCMHRGVQSTEYRVTTSYRVRSRYTYSAKSPARPHMKVFDLRLAKSCKSSMHDLAPSTLSLRTIKLRRMYLTRLSIRKH